jgi:hypothetical protein
MRISCGSEVLSVRIKQENPRRVHRPDDNGRLFKGEILSSDSFSLYVVLSDAGGGGVRVQRLAESRLRQMANPFVCRFSWFPLGTVDRQ